MQSTGERKDLLPRIEEKRVKTQGRSISYQSNHKNANKFTFNLKTEIANSEYLKNWLQKDAETKKMQKIFKDNHKSKQFYTKITKKSINKVNSAHKSEIPQELQSIEFKPNRESSIPSSLTLNLQKNAITSDELEIIYHLQIRNKQLTKQKIRIFKQCLEEYNSLFQKMNPVLSQSLLKIGNIATYAANEYIYKETFPVKNIGIILWGQTALKYKRCKTKYNCVPGHTFGEEIIFEDVNFSSRKFSTVEKGQLCTNERCKAIKNSGILFIGYKEYGYMMQDLIKWGFKEEMLRFQNILMRNYLKKRQFRSLMY